MFHLELKKSLSPCPMLIKTLFFLYTVTSGIPKKTLIRSERRTWFHFKVFINVIYRPKMPLSQQVLSRIVSVCLETNLKYFHSVRFFFYMCTIRLLKVFVFVSFIFIKFSLKRLSTLNKFERNANAKKSICFFTTHFCARNENQFNFISFRANSVSGNFPFF